MPIRQLTPVEIERHKTLLAEVGDVGLLMPTATGLQKSILDATISIRALLKSSGLHDYAVQPQGADGKAVLVTRLLSEDNVISSRTPEVRLTKRGLCSKLPGKKLTCFSQSLSTIDFFETHGPSRKSRLR